ncbi:MAG TPA: amino acid ABC transporter permease [Candidatus Choladousia intestinipullorum]|nr:amino acid ABC transporter permease [Candidatus Choladousia intestinipullorum]
MELQWIYTLKVIPTLAEGLKVTMLIAVAGILLGFIIGLLAGFVRSGKHNILYRIAGVYITVIRGTPLMVQALYLYFAIPMMLNFDISALTAGIVAIGLNSGAYISEIVRGAIQSIDIGQNEAGICLGLSKFQITASIIFPQAFKIMLPSLCNQFIISVKDTSILTVIGVAEMTRQATQAVSSTFRTVEIYTSLALMYFVLNTVLSFLLSKLERRMK